MQPAYAVVYECVAAAEGENYKIKKTANKRVDDLQKMFEKALPDKSNAIFTKVPRGLIVTIDENIFFNEDSVKIKESSLPVLSGIAEVLKQIDNEVIIEGHNKDQDMSRVPHELNWEISLERANNISKYLVMCQKVNIDNLFTLGFGEMAPYESNVSREHKIDNRIDFIILDYEEER